MSERRGMGGRIAAALILVALAATVYNFWYLAEKTPTEPGTVVPSPTVPGLGEPVPSPSSAEEAEIEEGPSLEGTDELVRRLAAGLSSHPGLAKWLVSDGLIRRFVVAVDNVAEGVSPRKPLAFLTPEGDFRSVRRNDREVIDPRSYARYDLVAEVFASFDPKGSAELYRELKPYVDAAYRELGYPHREFDDTLDRAIATLLDVPVLEGEVPLDPRVTTHEYADNRLEELSGAKKQLLRMGPKNVRKIQDKLRDLRAALASASDADAREGEPSKGEDS